MGAMAGREAAAKSCCCQEEEDVSVGYNFVGVTEPEALTLEKSDRVSILKGWARCWLLESDKIFGAKTDRNSRQCGRMAIVGGSGSARSVITTF